MKKIIYRCLTGFLLAAWMVVIFRFSDQPAEESAKVSESVAYRIVNAADEAFGLGKSIEELKAYAEKIDHPVRKAAHMTEYAILGLLSLAFYAGFGIRGWKGYAAALVTAALYAATDEFHQLFIPGRSGEFKDVCLDTFGAAIGLILCAIILKIKGKHCEKKPYPIQ